MVTREVGRDWALTISGRDDERKKERERIFEIGRTVLLSTDADVERRLFLIRRRERESDAARSPTQTLVPEKENHSISFHHSQTSAEKRGNLVKKN